MVATVGPLILLFSLLCSGVRGFGTKTSMPETMDISSLPLPPNNGFNLYRNLRDSFSYLANPDRFVAKRTEKLGNVFVAHQFFKPVVFLGGREAVRSFAMDSERKNSVIHAGLPEIFMELHTKWGALNLDINDEIFIESRALFADVLQSQEAQAEFSRVIEKEIEAYVFDLAKRVQESPDATFYLVPELKSLCLQVFSKFFSGQALSPDQEQQFESYNNALLSLARFTEQYKVGRSALDNLKAEMVRRFRKLDDPSLAMDTPGKWYHDQVFGRPNFEDEDRIGSGMVLFIWGAYIECASLMADSLILMSKYEESTGARDAVRNELQQRREKSGLLPSDSKFWNEMPYTVGVMRETLRVEPPGAGVPRFSKEDFAFQGYRIPAGMPVMLEPRIGNMDPELHPQPTQFEPLRWVSKESSTLPNSSSRCPFRGSALNRGPGSWFPGGFGAHQCPGVPLAELVGKMFLSKVADRFDSWSFSGEGLTKNGDIDYTLIPVKIPPDNFGLRFEPRSENK